MSAVESRTQFVKKYARRSGLSDEWSLLGFIQIGSHYRIAMPCDCDDDLCNGWQMVAPDAASDIALSLTTKSAARIAELEAKVARLSEALVEIRDSPCMDPDGNSAIARAALDKGEG